MKLPWRTKNEEEDPYWDFFISTPPSDELNWLGTTLRNAPEGAIKPVKDDIHTPEVMARHTKELGRFLGADLVGIASTDRQDYPFAVLCAFRAAYDPRTSPGIGGQLPVQRGLYVTFILSAWIRELGYQGTTKLEVNSEQLAANAGMGTLTSDGRLVTPEFGPKTHVAGAILTDLPLALDGESPLPLAGEG